jgi:uncharacterized protein (DUF1778 family)
MDNVSIRLSEHVRYGATQILARLRVEDKRDITQAARLLGLTQSQFVRNVLVQTARAVIAERKSEEVS